MKKRIVAVLVALLLLIPTQALARSAILDEPATFSDRAGGVKPQFAASNHVLMLRADGRLLGWGDNHYGQLGLGDSAADKYNTPTEIPFFKDKAPIKQIATLSNASYALLVNGEVYTCGQGANGRLGQGLLVDFKEWRPITGSVDLGIFALYTNPNSASVYALTADDTLLAVGQNDQGQLGIGSTEDALAFTKVMDNADIRSLHIGKDFAVILHMDGVARAAGNIQGAATGLFALKVTQYYANDDNYHYTYNYDLTKLKPLLTFMGGTPAEYIKIYEIPERTAIYYKGNPKNGMSQGPRNGDPQKIWSVDIPLAIKTCKGIQYGNTHGIMQQADGTYIGWGNTVKKQLLGQAATTDGVVLTALNDKIAELELQGYESIAVHVAGDSNYLTAKSSITNNYKTWGWGSNTRGKLGVDSELASFADLTEIIALEGFKVDDIVAGIGNVFFVNYDTGEIRSTGDNAYGQLGLGDTYSDMTSNIPQMVPDIKYSDNATVPSPVTAINAPDEVTTDDKIAVEWVPEGSKVRAAATPGTTYALTRAVNGGTPTVLYSGDLTTYTDTPATDWTTAEYAVRAVSFVGDYSEPVAKTVNVKAGTGGGSGGSGGDSGGGTGGGGTTGGGSGGTNVTVRPDITVNIPKLDSIAGAVQQPPVQYIMPSGNSGEPTQFVVNMPDAPDYSALMVELVGLIKSQSSGGLSTMPTLQPTGAGALTDYLPLIMAIAIILFLLMSAVCLTAIAIPYLTVGSRLQAGRLVAMQAAALPSSASPIDTDDDYMDIDDPDELEEDEPPEPYIPPPTYTHSTAPPALEELEEDKLPDSLVLDFEDDELKQSPEPTADDDDLSLELSPELEAMLQEVPDFGDEYFFGGVPDDKDDTTLDDDDDDMPPDEDDDEKEFEYVD